MSILKIRKFKKFFPLPHKENPPLFSRGFFFGSVAALPSGFRLLLALYAGLLIMLTLTNLGHDAGAGALALETLQSAFQGFVFLDTYFRHLFYLPSPISPWHTP